MVRLSINGQDAKATWGLRLTHGALAALMTPPPMKDRIVNKARQTNGARPITNPAMEKVDERQINLPVHFVANGEADFLEKYAAFCEVLKGGRLELAVTIPNGRTTRTLIYNTYYLSCTSYSHFYGGIAKFMLRLQEYNPANDTE